MNNKEHDIAKDISRERIEALSQKLNGWLADQGVQAGEAAMACALLIGYVVGTASTDEKHMALGIQSFSNVVGKAATNWYEAKRVTKGTA